MPLFGDGEGMRLDERCREAEARIRKLQVSITNPSAACLEACADELREVIRLLAEGERSCSIMPCDRLAVQQFKRTIRRLGSQLDHGSNLCLGWLQLCAGAGYTDQGRPLLSEVEVGAGYEA